MDVTATVDVKNASFKGVSVHVQHDKDLKHSNDDIDFDKTKFNIGQTIIKEDSLKEMERNIFEPEFKAYNEKQKASGHKARMKDNVHQYLLSKKQSFDKTIVATFAKKQVQEKLLKNKSDEEVAKILELESKALADYALNFNDRNKNMKLVKFVTNVDESTPHVHAQLIGIGDTSKKGKVSISFSNMIKRAYKEQNNGTAINDSRKALRWWRKQEDQALVDSFNKYLGHELNIDFNLYRTGEHIADFDSYKRMKEINEHDKALEYAEEIKYYDPNHVVDKLILNPSVEKDEREIEIEKYKEKYSFMEDVVGNIDTETNNSTIQHNIEKRKLARDYLEKQAVQNNKIPPFGKYKNMVSEMCAETDYEKIPYIITDDRKVFFKDQLTTNENGEPLFEREPNEPISTEKGLQQHLRLGIQYLKNVARTLREKFQKELRELKKRLQLKEKSLNERAEKLDQKQARLDIQSEQIKKDQHTLKNASGHQLMEIHARNSRDRDFGPSL